jgi:hypothetical protein
MGDACTTYGRLEYGSENLKERGQSEDPEVDGKVILRRISKGVQRGNVCVFICLATGTIGWLLRKR